MKTKIIPFDLETAKKIQTGEIEGVIKTRGEKLARILCSDLRDAVRPIVAAYLDEDGVETLSQHDKNGCFYWDGTLDSLDLVLEVPDNEPQFRPFDKVLVRCSAYNYTRWQAAFYSHYTKDKNDDKLHVTTSGAYYMDNEILPYAGNEHLVGTTDKPKED